MATTTKSLPVTTTTVMPLDQPGGTHVIVSPSSAAPGTRVSITGDGFTDENWQTPNTHLWIAGGAYGCNFFAEADHDVTVTPDGHLAGSFVVPSLGHCRQSALGDLPVTAGHYQIKYQCTACTIGEFDVTADAPATGTECQDVGFAPNSDNMAGDIVAYGLSCEEAEGVVQEVGAPLGPLNGAAEGEADGFTCVRTSQEEGQGMPTATYECTRGSQRITFTRT